MSTKTGSQTGALARPSFDEVYWGSIAYVSWLLRHLGVPEDHCDDAVQEVFAVVHQRLPEYEPRDKLRAWLGAIAANVAAKFRHREGRSMETTEVEPDAQDEDLDLFQEVASADEIRLVLQEVDPELRFVFVQHYLAELSIADIAKHLDVLDVTVKARLRLARKAVRAAWTRYKARERHTDQRSNIVPILEPMTFMEAGRQIPEVPEDVRARVWAGIQDRLAGSSGPGDGPETRTPGSAAPRSSARGFRAALATPAGSAARALLIMVVGVAIGAIWDPLHRPSTIASGAPTPTSVPAMTTSLPPTSAPAPTAVPGETPPATQPSASSSAADVVDLDNVLADRAESALRDGQVELALASAQQHAAVFHGGGKRAHDREVVWIAALIRAGRTDEAQDRLARFASRYPTSPRLAGFRKALGAK
jgi:RNA polymerase sigma-70 factor (ECF subfamily)